MLKLVLALTLIVGTLAKSVPDFDGRIVGGEEISIRQAPYQVSVQLLDLHWCGGSLIADDLVLTATHCFYKVKNTTSIKVRVGSSVHNDGGQLMDVKNMISHDNYDDPTNANDITLIRLSEKVKLSDTVKIIKLATKEDTPGTPAFVTGWGQITQTSIVQQKHLRGVHVSLISQNECRERFPEDEIFDYNVCAFEVGKDSCLGDSGGPLTAHGKLYGIVSWGRGCATHFPGVYTSVVAFSDWIKKTSRDM